MEYDPGVGKRVQNVWSKRWTRAEKSGKIERRKEIGADAETFLNDLADHPAKLGTYTPETLKRALEGKGCNVKPLSGGNYINKLFEEGGGYKVNFSGDGLLMYHPERGSHHGGAYYKILNGRKGIKHYDLNGNELKPTGDI